MNFNYLITFRNGKSIRFHGEVDTITCFGYLRLCKDGKEQNIFRLSDVQKIRKA